MEVLAKRLENVDLSDSDWETPLHLAAMYSVEDAVKALVLCNAHEINGRDRMFRTPLLVAVVHNATLKMVEALVSCGADVNLADSTALTPLHIAVTNGNAKVTGALLQSGADVNATDEENNTPLHLARDADVAQVLLEHGADVNARNDRLQGALHLVVARPATRGVIELLLQHKAEMNARDDRLCTPLHEAVESGQIESVEVLLQRGADVKLKNLQFHTAFHEAACHASAEIVELLLRNGADINSRDERSRTPLHLAVAHSSAQVVDALIRHGAEVNASSGFGPLQVAVLCGKFDNAEVLLSHGADPGPALHAAVSYGQVDGVELLLRRGAADVNARAANTGNTPLHVCRHVRVLQLLMGHGAVDVRARNDSGQTPAHTMCCLSIFGDEYHLDCEYGMMTEFLECGADVNEEDASGETPFTRLVGRYKHLSDCDIYDALELEKIILEMVRHVKRLVVLGAGHLSAKNQHKYVECMTSQDVFYRWFRRLLKKGGFDDAEYAKDCEMELERLRSTRISRYTTLHDVISLGSTMKLSRISVNNDLKSIAESREYNKRFPIYFYLIKLQYQRGLTLRPLYQACEVQLEMIAPKKMNKLCIDGILQYLTEFDLECFVKAYVH